MCRPTAQILSDAGVKVTVACRTLSSAQKLAEGLKNAHPTTLDIKDEASLDAEVAKNDLIVSLVPYTFHAVSLKVSIHELI